MAPHKTITINGRIYDAVTGLPVEAASTPAKKPTAKPATPKPASAVKPAAPVAAKVAPKAPRPTSTPRPDFVKVAAPKKATAATAPAKKAPAAPRQQTAAGNVHSTVQRSQTLNRRVAKKPAAPNKPITRRPTVGRQIDMAKSADVSRFAKHPATAAPAAKPVPKTQETPDKPVQAHPVAQRAIRRTQPKKVAAPVAKKPATAKEVKEAAISKALATPKAKPAKKKAGASKKGLRRTIIISAVVLVVLAALFAVYRLFPTISVSVAAAQAGIEASYPEYTPDGYSLSQPVTYSEGEVSLKFRSHSNDNYYTVTQTRSSWDSSAVLDNVVTPAAGADYVTTKERGLTIYTYDSSATWVNGGILYKIDSKAPLSGDQIRKIATSL